jgi:Rod binding domain-containing protein
VDISEVIISRVGLEASEPVKEGSSSFALEQEHRKRIARDFESIFIRQLLETMKETIPESDLEDSSSKQVESMYWSFLGDAVAEKGGFGLWEKIYESMNAHDGIENSQTNATQLDESV